MEICIQLSEKDPSHVNVSMTNGVIKKNKYVHTEDVIKILNSNTDILTRTIRTGKMPRGFVDSNMDFDSLSGKVAVFVPAAIRRMDFNGEKAMIPFPSLILVYQFRKRKHYKTLAFAVKESSIEQIRNTTILYNYPFGNVSPGTGDVCWGNNRHEELVNISDINIYTDKFLNSSTNKDLYQVGISNASKKEEPVFLNDLQKQVEKDKNVVFNPDYLVQTTHTLDNIMGGIRD